LVRLVITMSELSKSSKKAQEILSAAASLTSTAHCDRFLTDLDGLGAIVEKARARLNLVDPITGAPLYGSTMMGKISSLEELLGQARAAVLSRRADLSAVTTAPTVALPAPPISGVSSRIDDIMQSQNQSKLESEVVSDALMEDPAAVERAKASRVRGSLAGRLAAENRSHSDQALRVTKTTRLEVFKRQLEIFKNYPGLVRCNQTSLFSHFQCTTRTLRKLVRVSWQ
jgi:hypothetical protein